MPKQYNDESSISFIQIDVRVWDSLNLYETRVYGHIKRRAGQNSSCWESLPNMAIYVGISRSKLITTIQTLIEKGLLRKEKGDLGGTDSYWLTSCKHWVLTPPPSVKKTTPVREVNYPPSVKKTTPRPRGKHKVDPSEIDPSEIDPSTHISPTPSEKSADADVCVDAYLEVEIVEPEMEPEQSTPPAQPDSNNSSLAVSAISREGELSRECSMIPDKSMATANFDNRMRYTLTPARIAETASKVLSMFNAAKPLYWKSLGVVQKPLKEHCEKYIKDYLREGKDTDEAIGLFEDDFKYSLIGLKTSKFHTSKDFENGNIYWLLEKDRVYKLAGTGRSLSPTEQAIVADKLIGDTTAKVIRDFHNGKVLSDTDMYFRRNSYRKLLKKQDPDAPTIEYLQENFPELLAELTENK